MFADSAGNPLFTIELARALGEDRPVYGLPTPHAQTDSEALGLKAEAR